MNRPRDTRSTEIKRLLKRNFPNSINRVRIDKYSMGESINVYTDQNIDEVKKLLASYENIDRDEMGEILSGGNTFLFIGSI